MPVGTRGAVKAVTPRDLREVGAEIILGNTYHLWLRPGDGLIARLGGLHRFIGWDGPILTDSGGFQAFSLGERRVITEAGIRFRSHLDGSEHLLTPEGAAEIQAQLGPDIAMVLDECLAQPAPLSAVKESTERSARWARRGRDRFLELQALGAGEIRLDSETSESRVPNPESRPHVTNPGQAQFGIIQGGTVLELRTLSVERTLAIGSRLTRSAASASANRLTLCTPSSRTRPLSCRQAARGTSWESARRWTSWRRFRAASISSTA